jgi:TRAP-type mannitol/chloroaromatic compound transport system substrate-binding protein
MSRIFISYRRDDSAPYAGRLYDRLAAHFGADQVFMDIDRIEPGENFIEAVNRNVDESGVVLVMIGPGWVRATDAAGQRRLDDQHDFVRMEVAAALARGVRVIPVRVGGASMPRASELPDALQPLVERQAIELSDTRFHTDVGRLIEAITKALSLAQGDQAPVAVAPAPVQAEAAAGRRPAGLRFVLAVLALVVLAVGGTISWLALRGGTSTAPAPTVSSGSPPPRPATQQTPLPVAPAVGTAPTTQPTAPPAASAPAAAPAKRAEVPQPAAVAQSTPAVEPAKPALMPPPAATAPKASAQSAALASREATPATAAPPPPGPLKLRVQDTFGSGSSYTPPLRTLLDEVAAAARGLSFERLPSTGVAAGSDAMAALRHGTLDGAWMLTSTLAGRDEAFSVLEGPPFGPGLARCVAWRGDAKVRAIAEQLYAVPELKGMLCGVAPGWDLWLKAPLQSGADLRGKKIRAIGLRARVYTAAGATLVTLSPAEVPRELATGAVDAAEYLDASTAVNVQPQDAARRWHAVPLSRAVGIELVFRRSVWEQLDTATQRRIETGCAKGLAQAVKAQGERVTASIATLREAGAPPAPLPPALATALHEAWRRVQSELAANSAAAALLLTVAPYSTN